MYHVVLTGPWNGKIITLSRIPNSHTERMHYRDNRSNKHTGKKTWLSHAGEMRWQTRGATTGLEWKDLRSWEFQEYLYADQSRDKHYTDWQISGDSIQIATDFKVQVTYLYTYPGEGHFQVVSVSQCLHKYLAQYVTIATTCWVRDDAGF